MTAVATRTERVPLARLKPADWNPRLILDERFKNLCRSIEADPEFLTLRPILATLDGTIFAGNMRYRAVQHLKWPDVPAILEDIPEQLAKERALRDNGSWGEWQDDDLAALIYELSESGSNLDLLGFEQSEIDRLLDSVGLGPDIPIPSEQEEPRLKAECFVEIYCSRDDLESFQDILNDWAGRPSVTLNIS